MNDLINLSKGIRKLGKVRICNQKISYSLKNTEKEFISQTENILTLDTNLSLDYEGTIIYGQLCSVAVQKKKKKNSSLR